MTASLLFHDFETFGANPKRDRPCQFAAIRTDEDLNIIDEPKVWFSQPSNDYLPHPMACLITGITPQQALAQGMAEPEFARLIHQQMSQPQTCTLGYNSLRFDDEVTRFMLYRNFYDPYEREWQHGNSRWDLIDMTRATYALRPDGIIWPENEDGLPSFKLESLSQANGLAHSKAHDALSDVEATIALAKLIRQHQPKLYQFFSSCGASRQWPSLSTSSISSLWCIPPAAFRPPRAAPPMWCPWPGTRSIKMRWWWWISMAI